MRGAHPARRRRLGRRRQAGEDATGCSPSTDQHGWALDGCGALLPAQQCGVSSQSWPPRAVPACSSRWRYRPGPCRFWDTRASKNTATVSTPGPNLYLAWSPDAHFLAVANKEDVVSLVDTRCVGGARAEG